MAKILVVDDNLASRKLVAAILSHEGHEILDAADATDGLAQARARNPQLVISDILMPTMDGYEFVRRIRADPSICALGVIFYTAYYHQQAAFQLAEALGVVRVLVKPCPAAELVDAVNDALANAAKSHSTPQQEFDHQHAGLVRDMLAQKAEELRSTTARLEALTELNMLLASVREPRVLLEKVCHGARDLIGARYAMLAVTEPKSREAKALIFSGLNSEAIADLQVRADIGSVGQAAADRKSMRLANEHLDLSELGLPVGLPPASALLMAPLASLSQTFGWILLADKLGTTEFAAEDEKILSIIGAQAGRI
jgi:CheY-like chemotaxis protein